jgi:pyruvate,orthophosphate dikinase
MGLPVEEVKATVERLHESNPMLGHRGCRLGITYPEVYQMQARAIFEAARDLEAAGKDPQPEIMVPLVGFQEELAFVAERIEETAVEVFGDGPRPHYLVGTMIEVPRAALTAGEIAKHAQFFSFGTNDLTQMGCGFSRDDAGVFLSDYEEKKIVPRNPFDALDQTGVGRLVEMGTGEGRATRPDLKVGICGEHGGDPSSVAFFHGAGLDYVSCSPYRLPVARLAAGQAALEEKTGAKTGSGTE